MTFSILGQLDQKIRDAVDGARSAGAALARSAHEVVETSQPETTATAAGTRGRSQLIDRETVRVLLTAANLARLDGELAAYGVVLGLLDEARDAERAAAVGRVEAEAVRDVETYRQALRDGETESPELWAAGAFDAWFADEDDEAIGLLTVGEARDCYVAAFLAALGASARHDGK